MVMQSRSEDFRRIDLYTTTINIYYESVINCGNAQNSLCLLFKSSYHVFGLQTQVQTDRVDTTHR